MTSPTPSEPRTGDQLYHGAPLRPVVAIGMTGAAVATIYIAQIALVAFGAPGLVAAIGGDVLALVWLWRFARARHITLADVGLRRVPNRFVAAAALLGLSTWYLTALLVVLIDSLIGLPGDTKVLEKLVQHTPLVPTLLALTIFPAITEELVFRGVLLRALQPRLGTVAAIFISAAVFGLYHVWPPAQMLSTFALGIVLAFVTLRARSIVPAIIIHALNNTVAVVLSRTEFSGTTGWMEHNGLVMLAIVIVLVGSGLALAAKGAA
jgi:uncharacterized protein